MLESAICLQVHHDGRAKPLTVGVSVHKDAKLSELLEAVKQHPAAACSPEEELVVGYCTGEAPNPLHTTTLLDASQETNEKHAKRGCALVHLYCGRQPAWFVMHMAQQPGPSAGCSSGGVSVPAWQTCTPAAFVIIMSLDLQVCGISRAACQPWAVQAAQKSNGLQQET